MKKLVMMAVSLFVCVSVIKAQKVEGNLDFLKKANELHVKFDYKGAMIKNQTEQQYIAENVKSKNKEKKGKGDEWKTEWETTTKDLIHEVFVKDLNKELAGKGIEAGDFPDAEYVATVKVISLDPGYMAGPLTKPSIVTVEVTFTKKGSPKVLAKVTIKKAKGSAYDFGNTYGSDGRRIGSSYCEAGEKLGKTIKKVLK